MVDFDLLSTAQAGDWITNEKHTLVQRAKAVWQLSGIGCSGKVVRHPSADSELVLNSLSQLARSPSLEVIAREGLRLTAHVLPLVSVLEAALNRPPNNFDVTPDAMPPQVLVGGFPSWVFDQYTRVGNAALRRACKECPKIAADLASRASASGQRYRALADAHFEHESANLARRAEIPAHTTLLKRVQALGPYRTSENAPALYEALRVDWGRFQTIRSSQVDVA